MQKFLGALVAAGLMIGMTVEADARSRNGSTKRYIHGNERFYETAINARVGANASYAEKFFAYVRLSR